VFALTLFNTSVISHEAANPFANNEQPHHHVSPPPQQYQHQQHDNEVHGHSIDRNMVQDQEHIKEHLDGKIEKPVDGMTEEELQFHYFKSHDYDDNNMLDGLELITALTHFHGEADKDSSRTPDSELVQIVDDLLRENDPNKDGFIEYAEFINAQRAAAASSTTLSPSL
jgi:hypothetical protein